MARYELKDGKSNKFWEIDLQDDTFVVRYGRIGTNGQTSTKVFDSAETAAREADKLTRSKVKKGYQLVGDSSAPPQDAPAGNPEAEAAIAADPEDLAAWQVYGDWLQTRNDPRGEMIALEVALGERPGDATILARMQQLLDDNLERWMGPVLAKVPQEETHILKLEWRFGFIDTARVSTEYDYDGPGTSELLRALVKLPAATFLRDLTVGIAEGMDEGEANFGPCVLALAKGGKRPALRRLFIGDFDMEECEISWSSVGDVSKLYPVLPNLQSLTVRGGGIELGALRHPALRELHVRTGGLPASSVRSLSAAELPQLEVMEIWFGTEEYGGGGEDAMLEGLLQGKGLPRLRELGLMNADFQNDIARSVVQAPLARQLELLDLSMGTMTDSGAQALLDGAKALAHLRAINVDENGISEEMCDRLREVFGDRINIGTQEPAEDEEDVYVSVGE